MTCCARPKKDGKMRGFSKPRDGSPSEREQLQLFLSKSSDFTYVGSSLWYNLLSGGYQKIVVELV